MLKETGRTFRYHKGEKFFAWRDANAPEGCELGLNLKIEVSYVEWILVFATPSGHTGGPFSGLARDVKQLSIPKYRHDPPHPRPHVANKAELADVIDEGLAFYDEIAAAIAKQKWK